MPAQMLGLRASEAVGLSGLLRSRTVPEEAGRRCVASEWRGGLDWIWSSRCELCSFSKLHTTKGSAQRYMDILLTGLESEHREEVGRSAVTLPVFYGQTAGKVHNHTRQVRPLLPGSSLPAACACCIAMWFLEPENYMCAVGTTRLSVCTRWHAGRGPGQLALREHQRQELQTLRRTNRYTDNCSASSTGRRCLASLAAPPDGRYRQTAKCS
jgi:hypothetical protein